jgi:hypothetical protein
MLKTASDPVAAVGAIFGNDIVATVTEVCAAAVVDLEAEAAATGEPVTDQAATRIARSMVDRVIQRAGRTMALAPRVCLVPRARNQRAPRARRAPRRAVRLSAVASAGDGPPPAGPPPSRRAPGHKRLSFGVIRRPDALAREVDEAQVVPPIRHARVVLDGVVRRVEVPS